jgi:hypothetical protein
VPGRNRLPVRVASPPAKATFCWVVTNGPLMVIDG